MPSFRLDQAPGQHAERAWMGALSAALVKVSLLQQLQPDIKMTFRQYAERWALQHVCTSHGSGISKP